VSFVSVTQQFNTTTSMGRLTLNVLLSFAQFEREVTSERIRDKIAASQRKGLWVGGMAPLGYETKERRIVVYSEGTGRTWEPPILIQHPLCNLFGRHFSFAKKMILRDNTGPALLRIAYRETTRTSV
jgi:hypothetical protein